MPNPRWFASSIAAVLISVSFVACAGDDSDPDGGVLPSQNTGPTPVVTKAPLASDATQVEEVLSLDGFREFAAEFAAAVDANDRQFFIDNAYYQIPDCPVFGEPASTSHFCLGLGVPPTGPGIFLGVWNSEGGIASQEYYENRVRENLDFEGASLYALGQQENGLGFGPSEVDIVVSFPLPEQSATPTSLPSTETSLPPTETSALAPPATALDSPSPTAPAPLSPSTSAFRLDRIDGAWRIVGIDAGRVNLVPDFFDWYTLWDDDLVS